MRDAENSLGTGAHEHCLVFPRPITCGLASLGIRTLSERKALHSVRLTRRTLRLMYICLWSTRRHLGGTGILSRTSVALASGDRRMFPGR